jgi:hypothetical protein
MNQLLKGLWWMTRNSFKFFCKFAKIFVHEMRLSAYYLRKIKLLFSVIPCFPIFSSKSRVALVTHGCLKWALEVVICLEKERFWLSAVYWNFLHDNSRKDFTFRGLSCGKACLSAVWFAETFDFLRIILRKGMPFYSTIHRKCWLSANYPAERHSLLLFRLFFNLGPRQTQYTTEVRWTTISI